MKNFLNGQFENHYIWSCFIMAIGGAGYFVLGFEPNIPYPFVISALCFLGIFLFKPKFIIRCVLVFIFGFCYANAFTKHINTPTINKNLYNQNIIGTVSKIDYTSDKNRLFLSIPSGELDEQQMLIRVSVKPEINLPDIGDKINATVSLFKPNTPFAPNAFDYSRWAYFNGIGGTGYLTDYELIEKSTDKLSINQLRDYLHKRSDSFLVDTLILGYKNAIPKQDATIWTATGVGHIWSISGYHMALLSAWLFLVFYFIFRSIPPLTRRIPARYPALILSLLGLLFYLFLSGSDVATIRSFFMTGFGIMAFLLHRDLFNLRNVCIAFVILFLINPHYIMQPGFQLSFSAVFGLVWYLGQNKNTNNTGLIKKTAFATKNLIFISMTAFAFTAPFVISHFNSINIYSLLGNLILLPVFSVIVMPLVITGMFLSLFDIHIFLHWANSVYEFLLNIGAHIASLPYSMIQMPTISGFALFCFVFGFLCLILIKNTNDNYFTKYANKYLFIILVFIGCISVPLSKTPIFYTTADNELIAYKNPTTGDLNFNKSRSAKHYFAFETWKKINFQKTDTPNTRLKHDDGLYIFETKNWTAAYIQKFMPLMENIESLCADKDIDYIISYYTVESEKCSDKLLKGGLVIYESGKIKYNNSNRIWQQ